MNLLQVKTCLLVFLISPLTWGVPCAPPIITIERARFTFHSPYLVRMEWTSANGTVRSFEDRPSLLVVNRDAGCTTDVKRTTNGTVTTLSTRGLQVKFDGQKCGLMGFITHGCVEIDYQFTKSDGKAIWRTWKGSKNLTGPGNLKGSLQTMDCYVGPTECREVYEERLEPGLISTDGWVVVDDSNTPLFTSTGWRAERSSRVGWAHHDTDWLFFGHGNLRFKETLADFVRIAGGIPLMPTAAYGVWWSRYWAYNESGISEVVEGYKSRGLPLHMLVLDMDWHSETPDPSGEPPHSPLHSCNKGWGGYIWNRSLFSDPVQFQRVVHNDWGLNLVLNTHDQCGVQSTQGAVYASIAKDMGVPTGSNTTVACNLQNQTYTESLWRHAMRSEENEGVDFWWTDLCDLGTPGKGAGNQSNYRCIADNLPSAALWSNIVHATKSSRGNDRRGLVLTVDGGLGNHRYPQVGSGDTYSNWTTLQFQVYQTPTAANVGVAWTHDLGGFMVGGGGGDNPANRCQRDPELFLRWLQFGAVSPLFRTHCTHCEIRPWLYPNYETLKPVYRFRSALHPYIYSAQAKTAGLYGNEPGVLPAHPLYYEWPKQVDAYTHSGQYLFGPSLMVAPITSKADRSGIALKDIWLPPGAFVDWNTAEYVQGPAHLSQRPYALSEIPIFVRAGSVIPLRDPLEVSPQPDPLVLYAVPPLNHSNVTSFVYEDGGDGNGYALRQEFVVTRIVQSTTEASAINQVPSSSSLLRIFPRDSGMGFVGELPKRSYEVRFRFPSAANYFSHILFNGKFLPKVAPPTLQKLEKTLPSCACWWREAEATHGVTRVVVFLPNVSQSTMWSLEAYRP